MNMQSVNPVSGIDGISNLGSSSVVVAQPGFSFADQQGFASAMDRVQNQLQPVADAAGLKAAHLETSLGQQIISGLEQLNGANNEVYRFVDSMKDKGDLLPSELVHLTFLANDFSVRSQLTASVANKSSDGVQQLFRQQS
jgi:hypothetical protein